MSLQKPKPTNQLLIPSSSPALT